MAAVLGFTVVDGVPAYAAPTSTRLPDGAFESASDDPVPVPAGPAEAPSSVPAGPAVPWSASLTPEQVQAVEDLKAQTDALTMAAKTGKAVEIASRTTENSISFAQPSGAVKVESSAGPVRTKQAGVWVPVDTTLEFAGAGVRPKAVTGEITFSGGGTDTPMAVLGDGADTSLKLHWKGALPKPTLTGDTATYANVLPRVDLVLTATRQGFIQHLVVKQRPDANTLAALGALQFPLDSSGATVKQADGAHLEVRKGSEVVGAANAPVMWDARMDRASGNPAVIRPIGMDLAPASQAGTDATVVLTPPTAFLTDPTTVYPVTIDPTQTLGLLGDTFVQSNIANVPQAGEPELRVGSYNGGGQINRSLLLFDVDPAIDRIIQSAQLSLFETYSYSCSPRWMDIRDADWFEPNTVTWNSQPAIGGIVANANVANGYSAACPAKWVDFNLTNWLGVYADRRNGMGDLMSLAVTAGDEYDSHAWKKFASADAGSATVPRLSFTYDGWCDRYSGNIVCGAIRDKYNSLGGPYGVLGYPTSGEVAINGGWYNDFQYGSIYYGNATGRAHTIRGALRDKWRSLGAENSAMGYPTSDDTAVNGGWYNDFQYGSIYYGIPTGRAHTIRGALRDKWRSLGAENSSIGFPTSDDTALSGGWGNHFERGTLYYGSAVGRAHLVAVGPIRDAWWGKSGEAGWLGFPTSDPLPIAGGTRQEFEGGNLVFDTRANNVVIGAGVLKSPTQFQRVTQARTQLRATAKIRPGGVGYDQVKFQWRPYDLTLEGGWVDIPPAADLRTSANDSVTPLSGAWLPVKDEAGGKTSEIYTWNATSTIPTDGLMQARACLKVTGKAATDPDGVRCTGVTQITVDRAGLTGANATSDVGPGTVSLLTGAYAVVGRDVEVSAPHGGLAATRSFASNDPNRAGPLGLGWRMSLAVDEAGADYLSLVDRTETVLITRGDGTQMPFVRKSSSPADVNNYVAEGEASTEGATLTFVPGTAGTASTYVLTDLDGDKVTFTRADGGNGHVNGGLFRVTKVEAIRGKAGSTDLSPAITNVTYTAGGNPRLLLAPADAGAACPDPTIGAQPAGCRALEFLYTGTGAAERLTSVKLWAHGAAAPTGGLVDGNTSVAPQQITLANFAYDSASRLTSVTDPRNGQKVTYGYRADGRLQAITPVGGEATWTLSYDDRTLPRLVSATLNDGPDGLAPQPTNVRYDVPLNTSNSALPNLTSTEVKRWGQSTTPTDMTAVFGPDVVPAAIPTGSEWRGAQLMALDVNGRVVNTANFGGTIDQDTGETQDPAWRISTTEYDAEGRGNIVRQLSAGNRDRALAASADAAAEAAQAKLLDTVNVYSADGLDLLRSYQPARPVTVAAGDRQVSARTRTTTAYDVGNEKDHPTPGKSLHLPVRTTVDAVEIHDGLPAGSTGTDPALPALDGQSRVTTLEYGSPNAWKFSTPTATKVDPGGGAAEVVTRQAVDEQGRTTSSTLPAGGTSTTGAATTVKVYYSATNADAQCKNEAWAGWLCKSRPGGNPDAGTALPTSHVTGYDVYGNVTRVVETVPGTDVVRTVNTTYDAVGRARRSGVTGSGAEVGQVRPLVETTYTAAGLVAQTQLVRDDGAAAGDVTKGTGPIAREYDRYGRLTKYTDGSGLATTQSYDAAGRLVEVANTHGTRTIGYDGGGERGSLPTSLTVSGVGEFKAQYGADGSLVREELPGKLAAVTVRDAAGDAVSLTYTKTAADGGTIDWLKSTATFNGFDQVDSYQTAAATGLRRTNRYGYDGLGRLVSATDWSAAQPSGQPTGASCTRRYTFDVNSNRTGLTQQATAGAPAGTCPATVAATASYGYDSADRLKADAAARGALRYDALGRTRVLPSVDTIDGGGDVALDFYVDDLVASMSQGGRKTAFGLDAAARRVTRTDTDAAVPGERRTTSLYSGDDDNPDVVQEPDNSFTRNISSFGGLAAVVTRNDTNGDEVTLQLANLHGDIAATVPADATSAGDVRVTETTEYGVPWVKPAAGTTQARYGWLGTHQRDASTPGGLTLMGVRLYAPTLGRFLTIDPVQGGNPNAYVYPADPVNMFDLDGRWGWLKKAFNHVKKNWRGYVKAAAFATCVVASAGTCLAVGVGVAVATNFSRKKGRTSFDWRGAAIDIAFAGVGAGIGQGLARVGHLTSRMMPRIRNYGRHAAPLRMGERARGFAYRVAGQAMQTSVFDGMGNGLKRDARQR